MPSLANTLRRCHSTVRVLVVRVGLAFADLLAGREQFPARALGEGVGADRGEQVVGGVQLVAGL